MTKAEQQFYLIAKELKDVKPSKLFGAPSLKTANGKTAIVFWKEVMAFKLNKIDFAKAMGIKEARPFDPTGGAPMPGWVQLPFELADKWALFAKLAVEFVKNTKASLPIKAEIKLPRKKRVAEEKKLKEKLKVKKQRRVKPKKRGAAKIASVSSAGGSEKTFSKTKRIKNKPKKPF